MNEQEFLSRIGDRLLPVSLEIAGQFFRRAAKQVLFGTVVEAAYHGNKHGFVLASLDDTATWGVLIHASMSYKDRNPSWRELKELKGAFFGNARAAAMILPEQEVFVNLHQYCFHLWEIPGGWGIM